MGIINLVCTPSFTAKVTKVYTAATPSGGWVAVLPSPVGGLSQVVDAYFYSYPVCLGFSELLVQYNMISNNSVEFCVPYQVREQAVSSSIILESHGYKGGPFGGLYPSQLFH